MKRSSENWDFRFSDDLFDWWERLRRDTAKMLEMFVQSVR